MNKLDVVVVGEFNLDLVLYGLPENLPAEREVLATDMAMLLGGSPAITANNLARLGNRVGLISANAGDVSAQRCIEELRGSGVDVSRMVAAPAGVRTGVSVLLQHEEFRRTLTYTGTTASLHYRDLDFEYLCRARHFHLASFYLQRGLLEDMPRLLALLKDAGLTISLDTNDDPAGTWAGPIHEALRYVDLLMPNEREALALSGEPALEAALDRLTRLVPVVVVKRGAAGAIAIDRRRRWERAATPVRPVDAIGAGDSFNAGFLHGYLRGWTMARCLEFGNLSGAYSTTRIGGTTAFNDVAALRSFLAERGEEADAF